MTISKMADYKFTPQIFYSVLGLLIMLPLLKSGYIFALDMAFTPNMPTPDFASSSLPFHGLLHVLAQIIPADLLQKILLLTIIWLAGFGMYRLVIYLLKDDSGRTTSISALVAGLFFVINPFLFTRFMVGQLGVLMGYALLPWVARAILQFWEKPALKTTLISSLLVSLISIVSIHSLGLILLFMFVAFLGKIYQQRHKLKSYLKPAFKWAIIGIAVFLIISSFWLIPLALGRGYIADSIGNFGTADQEAFATLSDEPFGLVGNVAALYGFWADEFSLYILPKDLHSWWWMVTLLVWAIVAAGITYGLKRRRRYAAVLIVVGASSLVLALGAGFPINDWIVSTVPWFAGYREPQKFVGLLAVVYAVFIGFALYGFLKLNKNRLYKVLLSTFFVGLPFLYTPTMFWGFGGQLKASAYPNGWYHVNKKLNSYAGDFKVLFLPWHQYMPFSFAERTVINPADRFFDKPTIVSNEPELLDLKPQVANADAIFISALLSDSDRLSSAVQLKAWDIRFVILAKEYDYKDYEYLSDLSGLKLVHEDATITLYEVI